ncbi:biotin-dependent carboxyltransferase family protein [Gordonia phthalatica]|uniref:Allophanate hydrolase n=1 Tax=Gordonia phthalatica TaxID=1136941 RepID=A0A0N9N9Z3_9ACTN|nr:biotin-dependent carboxyltransferase family protein [Gordonia phthalatica]ALG83814.1 allophanate hydrolase [Gordonia phthalatica]
MSASLTVVSTGPLATFQDLGRPGFAHLGVPRSGAADLPALRQANRLVGNAEGAAAVEVTLGGWSARATGRLLIAVTGPAVRVRVGGKDVGSHGAVPVSDGDLIEVSTPPRGCRNYVAVRGGFDAPAELDSRSTDTLSGLGPAPLRNGDVLAVGTDADVWPATTFAPAGAVPDLVDLIADPGPRDDRLVDVGVLAVGRWTVTPASNRVGLRLDRTDAAPLPRHRDDLPELRSEGVPLGGVQIPPSGQPVIFLADHPVTGGYPVVAVLNPESVWRAAQLTAGDVVRLRLR